MIRTDNIGFEVKVETKDNKIFVLCMNSHKKVTGYYTEGNKHYLQDYEYWQDWEGIGYVYGDIKEGKTISFLSNSEDNRIINGEDLSFFKVKEILQKKLT